VTISGLTLEDWETPDLRLAVKCSKGTYIRVLAEDIGRSLGCGACLAALRRTEVGRFGVGEAVAWDALAAMSGEERQARLLGVDAMIAELPALRLDAQSASRVALGQAVDCPLPASGLVRLYAPDGAFMGLGEAARAGSLQPRRLVAAKAPNG
jgi:tRNA pseudouridine55 synthase